MPKLDYKIESPEERKAIVEEIIAETPDISDKYLEKLADYLVLCMEKQERKQYKYLTENHMVTVNKRELSFEGLAGQLENGEDGIYNLINKDRSIVLDPKDPITQKDIDSIPCLKQLVETIKMWKEAMAHASGNDAYIMRKALIDMCRDQYTIRQAYKKPIVPITTKSSPFRLPIDDNSYLDGQNQIVISGISLMDPAVVSAILCNYSRLKEDSYDCFDGDIWYLIQDFEQVCDAALEQDYPMYMRLVEYKIDGMQNTDIQGALEKEFGVKHSIEYISSLWRNKIPKLIAEEAKNQFLYHEFKRKKLTFKKCSKCGQFKPAHNNFFSINKTSKDHWYSICKSCRNKKYVEKGKT